MTKEGIALLTGLQHIGIPTKKLEESKQFYQKLGFQIALETENPATGEKVAFMKLESLVLEIYESEEVAGCHGAIQHFAINTLDIEKMYTEVENLGFMPEGESIHFLPFWSNGVKYFNITGVNGEQVEFSQYL